MEEKNPQKNEARNHTTNYYLQSLVKKIKTCQSNSPVIKLRKKYTLLTSISIMSVFLFIGIAMTPVIATPLHFTEEKYYYESNSTLYQETPNDPLCDTCTEAVVYTMIYAINHANENTPKIKLVYPVAGIAEAFTIWTKHFVKGVIKGVQKSGFELPVDINEMINEGMNASAMYSTLAGKIIAFIAATINYLLELCNDLKC